MREVAAGECDEYGIAFAEYPDCAHEPDPEGSRCRLCVPPGVREQRAIDANPDGYEAAVEAMLAGQD